MSLPKIVPNGLDGSSGDYLLPTLDPKKVAEVALRQVLSETEVRELHWWHRRQSEATFGVAEGIDPCELSEAGWGLIAARDAAPAVMDALAPLRQLRREQATAAGHEQYYQEFVEERGYRHGESKQAFLSRFGVGPGPANPANGVPYYLLIVGDPDSIPFSFQYQLDVAYAVGRVTFDTPQDYARYAEAVVESERAAPYVAQRRVALFAPTNPDDRATKLSTEHLVTPLASALAAENRPGWVIQTHLREDATKARLTDLMGGATKADLIFTASHGVGFRSGDPRQLADQGALVCQDWPGPGSSKVALNEDHYLAAGDISDDAAIRGSVIFSFACFGAGTPQMDDYTRAAFRMPTDIAPRPFVSRLPQRLLAHPRGGSLAFIGHVERAWGCSFWWEGSRQLDTFRGALTRVLAGQPVGAAMEYFNQRYAELSSDLAAELEEIRNYGKLPDEFALADMWTANNDARSYAVIGDPAVRLVPSPLGV